MICIVIFALVARWILYCRALPRAPDDDSDGPPIHGHTGLEIAWTAIPAVLVTAIAIVSAVVLAQNGDAGDELLPIDVTAQQFAWHFKYPDQDNLTLERCSCCRSTAAVKLSSARERRHPLVLGPEVRPEAGRRAGDHDDPGDHADEDRARTRSSARSSAGSGTR